MEKEFIRGYNAGLDAAIAYHEQRARAADRAASALNGIEDIDIERLRLMCIKYMMVHRAHADAFRYLRKES
jgi:hypothetical protein